MLFPREGSPPERLVAVGCELRWRGLASIWFMPRATIRHVLDETDYAVGAHWLAVVFGVVTMLSGGFGAVVTGESSLPAMLAKVLLAGPLVGFAWLYLGGFFTTVVGRLLGGQGDADQLRAAVAWGVVPFMGAFGIGFPLMQFFVRTLQGEIAAGRGDQSQLALVGVGFALAVLIVLAGSVWTWVTTALAIAETHAISAWRGFLCMLAWQTVPALAMGLASLVVGRIVG